MKYSTVFSPLCWQPVGDSAIRTGLMRVRTQSPPGV